MARMLLGAFTSQHHADEAVVDLKEMGYDAKEISVLTAESKEGPVGEDVAEGAASGAATGGAIGALAGLLAGVGVIPGLAGILIGGPIAIALGATGVAAATISGAVTGVVAGGLVGALVALGVPEEEARRYNEVIEAGGVVVGVATDTRDSDKAREIFERHGAENISETTIKESVTES